MLESGIDPATVCFEENRRVGGDTLPRDFEFLTFKLLQKHPRQRRYSGLLRWSKHTTASGAAPLWGSDV